MNHLKLLPAFLMLGTQYVSANIDSVSLYGSTISPFTITTQLGSNNVDSDDDKNTPTNICKGYPFCKYQNNLVKNRVNNQNHKAV